VGFFILHSNLRDPSNLVALEWDDGVSSSESIWLAAQFFTCCRGGFGSMSHIYLAQQLFALIETLPFRLCLAPYRS
jgi:hypothetical protein